MIILDTNVVSEILRLQPDASVLRWMMAHTHEVGITAITVAELSLGVEILPEGQRKTRLQQKLGALFADYRTSVIEFDREAAQANGVLIAKRRSSGRPLATEDAMIAATCLVHGMSLATRNIKDFDDLGLALINPWEADEKVLGDESPDLE